jgi:hypothetical protein
VPFFSIPHYKLLDQFDKARGVYQIMLDLAAATMEGTALNRLALLAIFERYDLEQAMAILREALPVAERGGDAVVLAETHMWDLLAGTRSKPWREQAASSLRLRGCDALGRTLAIIDAIVSRICVPWLCWLSTVRKSARRLSTCGGLASQVWRPRVVAGAGHFFAQLYHCERGGVDSSTSPCA